MYFIKSYENCTIGCQRPNPLGWSERLPATDSATNCRAFRVNRPRVTRPAPSHHPEGLPGRSRGARGGAGVPSPRRRQGPSRGNVVSRRPSTRRTPSWRRWGRRRTGDRPVDFQTSSLSSRARRFCVAIPVRHVISIFQIPWARAARGSGHIFLT